MICRFCAQWNPDSASRCSFCDNAADAAEDTTRDGQPAYIRNTGQQFQVPRAQASVFDRPTNTGPVDLVDMWRKGGKDRVTLVAGVVILVVIALGMLIHNC